MTAYEICFILVILLPGLVLGHFIYYANRQTSKILINDHVNNLDNLLKKYESNFNLNLYDGVQELLEIMISCRCPKEMIEEAKKITDINDAILPWAKFRKKIMRVIFYLYSEKKSRT